MNMDYIAQKPTRDYKVLIKCMTYNQEEYIKDALKGFVRQKTNFPFCALVVDDCSTDATAEIIKQYEQDYPDIIKGIYLPVNMYGNPDKQNYIKPWEERTQYIAYCEGDDYWIDDYKLQRQVDFLDEQPHYSAVAGNTRKISIDGKDLGVFSTKSSRDLIDMGELVRSRQFHTASIMYRQSVYQQSPAATSPFEWDMWRWCCLISQGPIRYEDEVICVYRCGTGVTASTSRMKWILLQEKWENILFKTFSPDFITYNDAFFPLLADVFSVMNNKYVNKEDKEQLRDLFKKYITPSLLIEMMPMMLRHYVGRMKSFLQKNKNDEKTLPKSIIQQAVSII